VLFDDERAVADAGIVLPATLAARLGVGLEALVEQTVDLGERPGPANPGAKVMTLVSAMPLGADCIDDCDLLRAGRTGQSSATRCCWWVSSSEQAFSRAASADLRGL
jgi:hypothetical protein